MYVKCKLATKNKYDTKPQERKPVDAKSRWRAVVQRDERAQGFGFLWSFIYLP